MGEEKATSRSN